jgi:hypothetical protein
MRPDQYHFLIIAKTGIDDLTGLWPVLQPGPELESGPASSKMARPGCKTNPKTRPESFLNDVWYSTVCGVWFW